MAPNWVEVLTDPAGVSTRASRVMADYRVAAALVLQGRLLDYSLQRERDNSLPPLDAAEWPVDQDRALLLAILHHVQGGYGAAIERFRQLLAGQLSPDAVLVSGVLGSMALAETDEHPACLELLEAIHARLRGPHEDFGGGPTPDPVRLAGQLLTGLHIGRRYAERGDWAAAIEATQAVSAVQPVTSKTVRLLRHVARGNLDNYRLRAPSRFHALPKGGRPPAVPEPVQRRLWDSRGALAQLLEDDARIAFTDPLRPTSYMTSEDRTDRHLWAATHHGEVLADFAGSRRGRSDLGRYRLLAAATGGPIRPDGQPESDDFSVLLQAGEHDGLERAARWFLRRGPLENLAEFVDRVGRRAWLAEYQWATLGLLRAAGDLLSPGAASRVVEETIALARAGSGAEQPFWVEHQALRTLAAVLPAAGDASHEHAAASLLALEKQGREPTLASAVRAALSALRWADVGEPTRAAWQWQVMEGADSDLADAVVLALKHVEPEWTQQFATTAYEAHPTLMSAAVAVDAGASLSAEEIARAVGDAGGSLRNERDDAQSGRYQHGGIDTALLLTVLLLRQERPQAWSEVLGYLADPGVMNTSKRRVLEFLASRTDDLPPDAADQLGTILRSGLVSRPKFLDTESPQDLEPQVLGLRLALKDVQRSDARDRLLRLASDPEPLTRIQAARVAPLAVQALGSEAVLVTVLLSRDLHHEVRAAAGAALMSIATSSNEEADVVTMAANELPRLADEPGVAVPLALLHAVRAGDATEPVRLLRQQIHALQGSRSAAVRAAALAAAGRLRL